MADLFMAKSKDDRVTVILECTSCVRNGVNKESTGIPRYISQKNHHNTPSRLELKKFCPYCYKHTLHGEIKKLIECSMKFSRELSYTRTSFGASFRSKESASRFGMDGAEAGKARQVSIRRMYSMIGQDGVIGALIAGAQMPLFALGVSQALVSYYMDWETTKHEVKKIAFLFLGGAVLTVIVHAFDHLCFGIMGERLTLRVCEKMFSAKLRNAIGFFDDTNNTSSLEYAESNFSYNSSFPSCFTTFICSYNHVTKKGERYNRLCSGVNDAEYSPFWIDPKWL